MANDKLIVYRVFPVAQVLMPKERCRLVIICPYCRTFLNVKSPWSIRRGARKKHKQDIKDT